MLAVVKEPHIEITLGGVKSEIMALLDYIRSRYPVEVLSEGAESDDDEELVDIRETEWWKLNNTPGHVLEGYRLKHDMTQDQLAKKSGICATVLSAYENDRRSITRRTAIRLARALGEDEATFYERLTS